MGRGTYSMPTKIKYVFRAIRNSKDKKHLLRNVFYVLKNKGIRGLKEAVVSCGKETEVKWDIFEKQQGEDRNFATFQETVLFVIYGDSVDKETSATYATINEQKGPKDEVWIVKNLKDSFKNQLMNAVQDYVFFIKEGDYVAPDMRGVFGEAMSGVTHKVIYCDECIYDEVTGEILQYYIKPDFSLYDMYRNDMMQQAVMFEKQYLVEHYHIVSETMGGNIFGWTIECARNCPEVFHIPRVLLLRKGFLSFEELSEQRNVLKQLLGDTVDASVTVSENGLVVIPGPRGQKVSIIILHETDEHTRECVSTILCNTAYPNYDVSVVIGEGSQNRIMLPKCVNCVACEDSLSYAQRCNKAVQLVNGEIAVIMMDTQRVRQTDWVNKLLESFSFPGIAAVSPKIVRPENTIRYAGMIAGGFGFTALPFNGEKNERIYKYNDPAFINRRISVLSASCFAVSREAYLQVGGFDEKHFDSKFSNAQLSFELQRHGFGCAFCADVSLVSCSDEWYESWYDKEHGTAYINLLKLYGDCLTEDKFFPSEMKYQYLRGVPTEFRIFQKKKHENERKSILIVSHDSMLGGATIALQYAACILQKEGYYVTWLSEDEGEIFGELEKSEVPYIMEPAFKGNDWWLNYAQNYDLVLCSTIMLLPQVEHLKKLGKQVLWWVHEASEYYQYVDANILSQENTECLHCLCGGVVAQRNFGQYFPDLQTDILLYGVPDLAAAVPGVEEQIIDNPRGNMLFLSIGTIEKRKGQDILAEAVRLLKPEIRSQCLFVFVGKPIQNDVFHKVKQLEKDYPDVVRWHRPVDRPTLMKMYQEADVVLCTSREDPMPVFVTEGMMQSKVLICSENTGSAGVLTDGKDGWIYHNNAPEDLAEKITQSVLRRESLGELGREARKTYERFFSMNVFRANLIEKVQKLLEE